MNKERNQTLKAYVETAKTDVDDPKTSAAERRFHLLQKSVSEAVSQGVLSNTSLLYIRLHPSADTLTADLERFYALANLLFYFMAFHIPEQIEPVDNHGLTPSEGTETEVHARIVLKAASIISSQKNQKIITENQEFFDGFMLIIRNLQNIRISLFEVLGGK